MWKAITDWYGNSTVIHYASLLALLAGYGFALLSVLMIWRRGSRHWRKPIPVLYAKVMTEMKGPSLVMVSFVAFLAGVIVDRGFTEWRTVERGPHRIKVYQQLDNRHSLVQNVDRAGRPVSKEWKLAVCPGTPNPAFAAGCIYDISYEVTSTDLGICENFVGESGSTQEVSCP